MSLLKEALRRIISLLESGYPIMVEIARSLQPGLSQEEIASRLVDFPYTLPTEVIELYQWRNGQGGIYPDELVPYERFLSLEDALKEYKKQIELAVEFSEEDLPWQELFDPHWLPVFKDDANYYVVSTSLERQDCSAIFYKSEYDSVDDVCKSEMFPDLTSMMLAVMECWETGAYYISKNIRGEDYLSTALSRQAEIWLKHQPTRKRAVELLLAGRKLELTKKELIGAYNDLVAINHPKAQEILERDVQDYTDTDYNFPDRLEYLLQELQRKQEERG